MIDAKYYKETLLRYREGAPKVRSAHLYQLLSYLRNAQEDNGPETVEGVLLYPAVTDHELRLDFELIGHRVRVWTIDLTQGWRRSNRLC